MTLCFTTMYSFPCLCTSEKARLHINSDHLECLEFTNSRTSVNYAVPINSSLSWCIPVSPQSLENHPKGGKTECCQTELSGLEINT